MSVGAAPWEWDCSCGLRNNVEHAFCMGCGRPAVAGRITATGVAVTYDTGPMTAPPTATFTTPFRVVDQRGRTVLAVDAGLEGARLSLCNAAGTPVVTVSVVEGGGALIVANSGGRAVVSLSATPEGGAVGVQSADGEPRAILGADAEGGFTGVSSPGGARAAQLRGTPGGGRIVLYDQHGRPLRST
jgi:hypothetical protein